MIAVFVKTDIFRGFPSILNYKEMGALLRTLHILHFTEIMLFQPCLNADILNKRKYDKEYP